MKVFVSIKTLFPNPQKQNTEFLSQFYQDNDKLREVISSLTIDYLDEECIKGKKVLLKPNWVKHTSRGSDEICLRTHDNFLLAALEIILAKKPCSVIIGDAPIQGCYWEKMISSSFIKEVTVLCEKYEVPVQIIDFRRVTFDPSFNKPIRERKPIKDYVIFDVGKESYLEPISNHRKNLFRVTNYNPDRLAKSHRPGMHKYCITKELFNADIIISLPKVKTHQKTGITAALKNIVGLNGDKDFLPHHRIGGTDLGGDCYPGKNLLRHWSELSIDNANRNQGKFIYWFWIKLSSVLWKLSFPGNEHHLAAGWHGNDTTWRMVLDLNKIAIFGKADGSISTNPERKLFSLCDGIIGGQGDGPLQPDPLPLGIISFTNHSAMNDIALATLMGFDPEAIPLLKSSLSISNGENPEIIFNNQTTDFQELKKFAIKTIPPPGWLDYL